ncbi:MAG: right-handed parallel beta-helix repeat-containing protein, partial [Patescibacteria group bacterium]
MAEFFIAPTGSDTTGDGSQATPWASIAKAYASSASGDTIRAAAGTYATSNVSMSSPRTILGPNAEVSSEETREPEAVLTTQFTFADGSDGTTVDGLSLINATRCFVTSFTNGASNIAILNNIVTGGTYALALSGLTTSLVTGWSVAGNRFTGQTTACVWLQSFVPFTGFSVSGNTFVNNTAPDGIVTNCGSGLVVENNTFTNSNQRAVNIKGGNIESVVPSVVVRNNTFNSGAATTKMFVSIGHIGDTVHFDQTTALVENNTFNYNTDTGGMWSAVVVTGSKGATVRSNTLNTTGTTVRFLPFLTVWDTVGEGKLVASNNSIHGNTALMSAASPVFCIQDGSLVSPQTTMMFDTNTIDHFDSVLVVGDGVSTGLQTGTSVTVFNNIYTDVPYAVSTGPGALVDARYNFWTDKSGPSGGINDPVTGKIANGTGMVMGTY